MRVPTQNPPPGIIGQDRSRIAPNYAVFPAEGIMDSLLPDWPGCILRFQATPHLGARFAQALAIIPAGCGTAGALDSRVQHFLYVQQGELEATIGGAAHRLVPGGYCYVPEGVPLSIRNAGAAEARALWVRKRWQPAPGVAKPAPIIGHRDTAEREENGPRWRVLLLGTRNMPMDFEMNIMGYAPGAHFWCVETHIMEHGMVMLQGQCLQMLNRDWHELWEGDFVWMGPFVPQQIYATGNGNCEYLLYKDVNRDVEL